MNALKENKGQAKIILAMLLVPVTFVLFLVMLMMSSPVLDVLFPVIDNMGTAGTIWLPGLLKLFVAFIPTIIILLWIYTMIADMGK